MSVTTEDLRRAAAGASLTSGIAAASRLLGGALWKTASLLAVFALWELLPRFGIVDQVWFPPLSKVLGVLWQMLRSGELQNHIAGSLTRSVTGFGLAAAGRRAARAHHRLVRPGAQLPQPGAGILPQYLGLGAAAGVHPVPRHRRGLEDRHRHLRLLLPDPAQHHQRREERRSAADQVGALARALGSARSSPRSSCPRRCPRCSPASGWRRRARSWC